MKEKMNMPSKKLRSGRWKKGVSGNPAGRPTGTRNKSTMFLESLLQDQSEALVHKAVELALEGDTTALRLCLERICPPRKDRPIEFELPDMKDTEKVAMAPAAILEAVAHGQITPSEAVALAEIVQLQSKLLETADLARRVAELEKVIVRNEEQNAF
jgi:hypothetical protein